MNIALVAPYAIFILLPFLAGGLGSYFSFDGVSSWYTTIVQPSWTPPNWVFGPVWTLLYICMGTAMALVYKATSTPVRTYLVLFFIAHLVVNGLWSYFFFGLHAPLLALVDIGLLWIMIVGLIYFFYPISVVSAYLLVPYLLWVTYASTLNAGVYFLNS